MLISTTGQDIHAVNINWAVKLFKNDVNLYKTQNISIQILIIAKERYNLNINLSGCILMIKMISSSPPKTWLPIKLNMEPNEELCCRNSRNKRSRGHKSRSASNRRVVDQTKASN